MKISASYSELSKWISDNSGKPINLSYGGSPRTVLVKLLVAPLYVRIEKVEAHSIVVSHQIGQNSIVTSPDIFMDPMPSDIKLFGGLLKYGAQSVGALAVNGLLRQFVDNPAITTNEDKTVTISLDKIPQVSGFAEKAELKGIAFDDDGASIDMSWYCSPS